MSEPGSEDVSRPLVIEHHHRPTLRARALVGLATRLARPYLARLTTTRLGPELLEGVARFDRLIARLPAPRRTSTERVRVNGVDAEWVHGKGVPADRTKAILYLHGGGWFFGGIATHRGLAARLSTAAATPALVLAYRMVPAVSLDEEIGDCVAGYRALLDEGIAADRIVVVGDSAGGHLVLATALRAQSEGLPAPAALVGLSGVYDLDAAARGVHPNARTDVGGTLAALDWMVTAVLDGRDPRDPALSPLWADDETLARLPPTMLTASSAETVLDDSERLATRLAAVGVPCRLEVWDGQMHVFQAFGLLPEARRSVRRIGRFVRRAQAR